MKNALSQYFDRRLNEERDSINLAGYPGPVITISREVGCNGLKLARKLAERLNEKKQSREWEVLSKEVFHESARELNLHPDKVIQIFKKTDKYVFDEILAAFNNRNYKSERTIVKTLIRIVRSFAVDGYCIIVGRAGHLIAKNVKNALHLRLFAPLEYRIETIIKNNGLSRQESILFIQKVEKERIAFRRAIRDKSTDDEHFDLYINRSSFSDEETLDLIEYAVDKKQILKDYAYKMEYY